MRRLIDIAGRTGQPPVRALLSAATGASDPAELLPHEIRYRNDQHHVIYGLYEGDRILGLIGLARRPADDSVEIRHFAVAVDEPAVAGEILEQTIERQQCAIVRWRVPEEHIDVARSAGFQPVADAADNRYWRRRPE